MDKYLGQRLDGRYEITELIGVVGMANVYKARDVIENRVVAVKILREEYLDNEEFLRRFKNESKAIAVLSHPNIVKVYDVSFSDRMQSIVMEYIDGITLKEYIEQQGALSWKEAVHFTVQILRALQHAHDKGIVHRDVKPQNIMLLSDGTIKITDFGIARFSRSETKTLTDRAIGSVHYISPEQAQGETTDARTDIYSVGVMLFEMLTGRLPFEAENAISVAMKQIQSAPIRPRSINPAIPEGLEEITMRAMQKVLSQRYQSAAEMLRDIDEFKRNPTILFEYKYLTNEVPIDGKKYSQAAGKGTGKKKAKKPTKSAKTGGRFASKRPSSNGEEEEEDNSIITILCGIAAAFVVVCGIFILVMLKINNPFATVPDVEVPQLVGNKYETVRTTEAYQGVFTIEVISTEFNKDYEKGVIYDQNPKAGRKVKSGTKIKVKVSGGQKMITLPSYISQEENEVYAKLKELGLHYETVEVYHDDVPAGYVVITEPGKGGQVAEGDTVIVKVSKGAENKMIDAPDLTGLSLEDAKLVLEANKLQLGTVSHEPSDKPEDVVISQDPMEGQEIQQGGKVNLVVSYGDRELPSVTLSVKLPRIEGLVKVQATIDGKLLHEELLDPSEVRTWQPRFEGEGTAKVQILVDEKKYQDYTIDFDEGTYDKTKTYNNDFE